MAAELLDIADRAWLRTAMRVSTDPDRNRHGRFVVSEEWSVYSENVRRGCLRCRAADHSSHSRGNCSLYVSQPVSCHANVCGMSSVLHIFATFTRSSKFSRLYQCRDCAKRGNASMHSYHIKLTIGLPAVYSCV